MPDFARDPVSFIDAFIMRNELNQPFALLPHQREILHLAFKFDETDRLPWDTIVWACPKKSGKTTINASIVCWWAFTQEAPNELYILANDFEQAQARVFRSLAQLIQHNPSLAASAKAQAKHILFTNGTTAGALASEYEGNAGSNQGLTSWDELWAYDTEADRRLWEELTPVPTRRNSIRFITTYAGFENESSLLRELYLLGVDPNEHPEGKAERLHPILPIYGNHEARIFCYWDHEPRMPWQTEAYRNSQRRTLRPNSYLRLHENRWTSTESVFITAEMFDACVDLTYAPPAPNKQIEIYLGIDASTKHDCAAVCAVARTGDRVVLIAHRIWTPSTAQPLDLEHTIEAFIRKLDRDFTVRLGGADPFQLHRSIMTLRTDGIPVQEFPQTVSNTTRMGQTLYDLIKSRNLVLYPDQELRQHCLNAIAIEQPRGFRLAKEKASRKIDGAVALAMAVVMADGPSYVPLALIQTGYEPMTREQIEAKEQEEWDRRREQGIVWLEDQIRKNDGCFFPGD